MFVDGGEQGVLGSCDDVVDLVRGGGRTGVVVVAPGHADGTAEALGKVDHVVILEGLDALGSGVRGFLRKWWG